MKRNVEKVRKAVINERMNRYRRRWWEKVQETRLWGLKEKMIYDMMK